MRRWMAMAAMAVWCGGCGDKPTPTPKPAPNPPAAAELPPTPENLALHNQGLAQLERYEYAQAVPPLKALAERHPESERAAVDHAIALMHQEQKAADGDAAKRLGEFIAKHPEATRARYVLGALLVLSQREAEARPHLEAAAKAFPRDVYAQAYLDACLHAAARVAANEARAAEADEQLTPAQKQAARDAKAAAEQAAAASTRSVLKQAPHFISVLDRGARLFRGLSKADRAATPFVPDEYWTEAERLQAERQRAESNPLHRIQDTAYHMMGPLADVQPLAAPPAGPPPSGAAFGPAVGIGGPAEWGAATSVTACDLDGDGRLDLFAAGGLKTGAGAALLQQADGTFRLDSAFPPAKSTGVAAALWGDLDNDGKTDAVLLRKDGIQIWHRGKSAWEDRSAKAGTLGPATIGSLCDVDHDGDLDLVVAVVGQAARMLVNKGDGTFAEAKPVGFAVAKVLQIVPVDLDGNDTLDFLFRGPGPANLALLRSADGKYQRAPGMEFFETTAVNALAAGDVDQDGAIDLVGLGGAGRVVRWSRDAAGKWIGTHELLELPKGKWKDFALADCDATGALGLVAAGPDGGVRLRWAAGKLEQAEMLGKPVSAWTLANLDAPRGPAFVGWSAEGPFVAPPGPGRGKFVAVALTGHERLKARVGERVFTSNKSGIGTRVAARAGGAWTVASDLGGNSAPGQSLQPLALGLGAADRADFVSLWWSNGDTQTELGLAAGKLHAIKEEDRTPKTSCPLAFCWNGKEWEFATDFLAVGGLGYLIKPGEHNTPSDPVEHLLLPAGMLQPKAGTLLVKLLEAEPELALLDRAALVAFDLPPGWRMHLDERHNAVPIPKVTHEARFHRAEIPIVKATNHAGAEATAALLDADFRKAEPPALHERYPGRYAVPQVLTLTFAEPLAEGSTLLAEGWVEFPNSQTVMAAYQTGYEFSAPKLEARGTDGQWKSVHAAFGYPAGMQRQMSLPLAGLPAGTKELRVTGDLQISWDRFALVRPEACPEAKRTPLALASAEHRHGGVPLYRPGRNGKPHDFDDATKLNRDLARPRGAYTRFGDVRELVAAADDASVTIGPGEETVLAFAALPPAPAGWTRRYVLETRGWCKGTDFHTRDSRTVEPYPATGFPKARRDALHDKYNTRPGH